MRFLKNITGLFLSVAAFGAVLTSCEESEGYDVNSPDWLQERIDSIANTKNNGGDEEELEGMEEDVYTIGATDFSTGWWAQFSKYYVIPNGEKWNGVMSLNINPAATNTYKNFAMIISNDVDRGGDGYLEYGAIRFDHQPSGNSEWGDYIDRDRVESNLTFGSDTDDGVTKLGGRVVITVDRTDASNFIVKMTNGTVTKTYNAGAALPNLNADATNENIRVYLVPEGSYINFLQSNIEPIGGFTSAEDKQPLSMTLNRVPKKVLVGQTLEEAMANVTAEVQFEQGVSKTVPAAELMFVAIPNMDQLGSKTLVAIYNKSFKGVDTTPITAQANFEVVETLVTYNTVGLEDNTTAFWGAHSDYVKVEPNETFISHFTNHTSGAANWNNFVTVLTNSDGSTEYAVVRADNFGWGTGYDGNAELVTEANNGGDWAAWLAAMEGAKVTTYVTNHGNNRADVKAVIVGNNGETYTQEYKNIIIDSNDFYFHFTVDGSHIVFDNVIGEEDNSTAFWGAHSENIQVLPGYTYSTNFINGTSGVNNWNNFCVVLVKEDNSEYAVVRADNFGWGAGYDGNEALETNGTQGDWATWLAAMDGAKCKVSVTNHGTTADINAIMYGTDGNEYTQYYKGISGIEADNLYFRFTVDGSHITLQSKKRR